MNRWRTRITRFPTPRWPPALGALAAAAVLAVASPQTRAADLRPDGRGGHITRSAAVVADLEERLLQAVREHRAQEIEQLVDETFEMTVAQQPQSPIDREAWIGALRKPGAGDWAPQHLTVREFGEIAVAGFVLRPQPTRPGIAPLYVVDTWKLDGHQWRLVSRHVAPATGARRGIPGDSPQPSTPKKI